VAHNKEAVASEIVEKILRCFSVITGKKVYAPTSLEIVARRFEGLENAGPPGAVRLMLWSWYVAGRKMARPFLAAIL
jgi:hypothetical protein